jgi:hypothetical protein
MRELKKLEMPENKIQSMSELKSAIKNATDALEFLILEIDRIKDDRGRRCIFSVSYHDLGTAYLSFVGTIEKELAHKIKSGAVIERIK